MCNIQYFYLVGLIHFIKYDMGVMNQTIQYINGRPIGCVHETLLLAYTAILAL